MTACVPCFRLRRKNSVGENRRTRRGLVSASVEDLKKAAILPPAPEVSVERGAIKVARVVQAFDCGAVVNPQGLKNQIAGAIMQGLGGALFEAIRFENGRIVNPHLAEYRVPRFSDLPRIEVVLVDRKDQRSMGAGETR